MSKQDVLVLGWVSFLINEYQQTFIKSRQIFKQDKKSVNRLIKQNAYNFQIVVLGPAPKLWDWKPSQVDEIQHKN